MVLLEVAVPASALACVIALAVQHRRLLALGQRPMLASAQGRVAPAVLYAFTTGMLPWAKESAAKHLPTYLAGVAYHVGIALALLVLGTKLAAIELPSHIRTLCAGLLLLAAVCGMGLLLKRLMVPYMRAISAPDDYIANLLVNATLIICVTYLLTDLADAMYIAWIALFVYVPFGKIRHCWFFFVSRFQFGKFYGYRGVIAPSKIGESSHE